MTTARLKTWIPDWLRPAPDSMSRQMHTAGFRGWLWLFNLVWSFWVFMTPAFGPVGAAFYWSIGISYPVFLLLIALIHVRPRREGGLYISALVLLACVNMPFNYSAWDYGVFACAYIPWFYARTLSPWDLGMYAMRFLMVLLPLLGVAYAEHWPWSAMVIIVSICTSVGLGSLAGRISYSKNAAERLSMDEVRRLAANAERERIGRDLHDLLGHTLSLITLKLELSRKLFDRDPASARRELTEAEEVARHALAEVRAAVTGIRATGLAGELASARLMLRASGVAFASSDMPVLPNAVDDVLALVLREAVTNIHRHAQASHAEVDVRLLDGQVAMRIQDDGRGGVGVSGNGLHGMRERVEAMDGTLDIVSGFGEGTELRVSMPLPAPDTPQKAGKREAPPAHVSMTEKTAESHA